MKSQIFLLEQGANRFRVQAYRRAANVLRRLPRSVGDIFKREESDELQKIHGVGPSITRSSRDINLRGRIALLDRHHRGESEDHCRSCVSAWHWKKICATFS